MNNTQTPVYAIELLNGSKQSWIINDFASIGKDVSNTVRIQDSHIQDRHFNIEVKNNKLTIKDLRTQSGTFVNDAQIVESFLNDGDIITVGNTDIVVHNLTKSNENFPLESKSPFWNDQLKLLTNVSKTHHPVLLLGPSGTGKDVLSQKIHECSTRKLGPIVSVNCSALTETLIESELFGHVKGSFTGAVCDRKGAFEAARGGTLFLDEIGDLPYNLQAKLLRAIENQEIRPVGSDKTIKTDIRIIAATHQNLIEKIQQGLFRQDLYFRLNVITIDVPSLKERIEDFETLLYTFAREMRVRFSHNAIQRLKKHEWTGNIRELKNLVTRASVLFPKEYIDEKIVETLLTKRDRFMSYNIDSITRGLQPKAESSSLQNENIENSNSQNVSVIREIEKQMIIKRLTANNGSQKLTALDLGMPKSTLHDRIKFYGIDVKKFKA